MGICKCRKRTDLFCYHCNKAVCYDCITDPGHKLAKISTYAEWLNDSTAPPPVCPLSKKVFTESDEVIRFMNLQIFLLEAISEYGASKPNITTLAGFTIPGTEEPMVPPAEENSKLAQQIREKLSKFPWISGLIALQAENSRNLDRTASSLGGSEKSTSLGSENPMGRTTTSLQSSVAPRKTTTAVTPSDYTIELQTPPTPHGDGDDPEYKYRPKPIRRMFEVLGFLSPASLATFQLTERRLMFIIALLCTLLVVVFLGMTVSTIGNEVQETRPGQV